MVQIMPPDLLHENSGMGMDILGGLVSTMESIMSD
jgi:hypothetical protein